jgi:hypothetical protein
VIYFKVKGFLQLYFKAKLMLSKTENHRPLLTPESLLWIFILIYIGVIYSTISIVPKVRISLTERFGGGVFNYIYLFLALGAGWAFSVMARNFSGKKLTFRLLTLAGILISTVLYLNTLPFAVEKIHFIEYGFLGILLMSAISIRIRNPSAYLLSVLVVYLAGLGDEAIQGLISNRVGEIRDSLTNLFSGGLGLSLYWAVSEGFPSWKISRLNWNLIFSGLVICILSTSAFLYLIHGFGFLYETESGRFYTSLTQEQIEKVNRGEDVPLRVRKYYNDEARRHLFQREFYLTNDFKGENGEYYRDYSKSAGECLLLETFYPEFLKENRSHSSSELILGIDKEVAQKVVNIPVMWPDSLRGWVLTAAGKSDPYFTSRVKSTLITSFSRSSLAILTVLSLLLTLGCWFLTLKRVKPE